ncbi:uncharacterized protein UV8b_02293 [Ustilaginoidea virens]|uniref:Uncharacterized protein n=1 Tax=Ustilaginoidea virens TaxID=1159556 RepID=A0A8E5MG03_USTVR|nr:uncharacterized protein UV8b_02293 [Ustilaginoidea virens]QUC18052.1 hypothetical protein UV8b_02293 [Ustilaginoidea virens]
MPSLVQVGKSLETKRFCAALSDVRRIRVPPLGSICRKSVSPGMMVAPRLFKTSIDIKFGCKACILTLLKPSAIATWAWYCLLVCQVELGSEHEATGSGAFANGSLELASAIQAFHQRNDARLSRLLVSPGCGLRVGRCELYRHPPQGSRHSTYLAVRTAPAGHVKASAAKQGPAARVPL